MKINLNKNRKTILVATITLLLFVAFAYFRQDNNIVPVKYGDSVNILNWRHFNTPGSAFVEGVWYDPMSSQMVVKLNGSYYQYCNVPDTIWNAFKASDSYGGYFNAHIKSLYGCEAIDENVKDNDFVFDHIIPLGLGGSDFSQTSLVTMRDNIESLPDYNESYLNCFYEAIKIEPKILLDAKYSRQSDGSWIDRDGNYPSSSLETNIESRVTESFKSCIK